MAKIGRVEEAPGGGGGSKPQGNYKFLILESTLMVETTEVEEYTGMKKWAPWDIVHADVCEASGGSTVPDGHGLHHARQYLSVVFRMEGPAVLDKCFDKFWFTEKAKYRYRQLLSSVGLDPDGDYDDQELVDKAGVAFLKPEKNRDGKTFLEPKRYFPKGDAPEVEVADVPEDDVPF